MRVTPLMAGMLAGAIVAVVISPDILSRVGILPDRAAVDVIFSPAALPSRV